MGVHGIAVINNHPSLFRVLSRCDDEVLPLAFGNIDGGAIIDHEPPFGRRLAAV
jgi:hypothetical protein